MTTEVTVIEPTPLVEAPPVETPSGTQEAVAVAQTIVEAAQRLNATDQPVLDALRAANATLAIIDAHLMEIENRLSSRLEVLQGLVTVLEVEEAEELEEVPPVVIPENLETPPAPDVPPEVRRRRRTFI
jgi:hypothetical protein